jgi:hypothetical protein
MPTPVANYNDTTRVHVGGGSVGASLATVQSAVINTNVFGVTHLVTGTVGQFIKVLAFHIVCAGAVSVSFQSSGGSVISGPMAFSANGGMAPPYVPIGHFETLTGEGLDINLSATIQVGGCLKYVLITP